MLKKTTILSVLLLSCLLLGSVSHADVTVRNAICNVNQTQVGGESGNRIYLNLTSVDGAFTKTWIYVQEPLNNYALATALTAIAMEKKVNVNIQDAGTYFYINSIRLIN